MKGQTADVKNLQQRVFAKYDLPERKVADGLLAFYHEKGELRFFSLSASSVLPLADLPLLVSSRSPSSFVLLSSPGFFPSRTSSPDYSLSRLQCTQSCTGRRS